MIKMRSVPAESGGVYSCLLDFGGMLGWDRGACRQRTRVSGYCRIGCGLGERERGKIYDLRGTLLFYRGWSESGRDAGQQQYRNAALL